ncbi:hypothetical protein [Nocardioides speluncae]|uniref:hypothetical protein n=1 Tax=Nocardioides speluncae TaxID=2670337 RepID=UPI0012B17901|nr:hypothetical protein [Nocardioides speluncae]
MTLERVVKVVERWVRAYTRGLPPSVAQRRADELGADLQDHIAHERARGVSDRRIALSILSRMVRGLAADTAWRAELLTGDPMERVPAALPPLGLGLLVAAVITVGVMPLVGGGAPIAGVVVGLAAGLIYARRRRASKET